MSPTGRLLVQENPDPTPVKNFRQGNYKWHSSRVTRKSHGQRNLARLQPMHYRKTNTLFLQVTVEMCCLEGLGGGVEDNSQVSGWDKCTAVH